MRKISLSSQAVAVQTLIDLGVIGELERKKRVRTSEAELIAASLQATRDTLLLFSKHEDMIRALVSRLEAE